LAEGVSKSGNVHHAPLGLRTVALFEAFKGGLDATQRDRVTRYFSTVANRRWMDGDPLPPDWPWHELPEG